MGDTWYNEYLKSSQWRALRRSIFARDGNKCTRCGSGQNLECHHLTYERLGRELPEDLETLCEVCHKNHHGMKQRAKPRKKRALRESLPKTINLANGAKGYPMRIIGGPNDGEPFMAKPPPGLLPALEIFLRCELAGGMGVCVSTYRISKDRRSYRFVEMKVK